MDMQVTQKLNGLDTAQMVETIAAIKNQPALARFQFRARNQWVGGENAERHSPVCNTVCRGLTPAMIFLWSKIAVSIFDCGRKSP